MVPSNTRDSRRSVEEVQYDLRVALAFRDGWAIARGLCNLARVASLQGEIQRARALLSQTFAVIHESQFAGAALADALEVLGAVEAAEGKPVRAATLFGAAETQWRASGGSRYPPDQPDYDLTVTRIRAVLDAYTYATAWRAGQAMGGEQAIEYASGWTLPHGLRQ